ncbi:hypothetical protein ACFPZ0_14525 [Streptomonospora nanhaiensis]|uniref:hypothetical protein n=1 Tax=Streptomonospora nanhaiensis TaxID=1323731 RepID=UPI001C9977B7|nr:hypothetical protein [Streptomonospora nanhaiensis]MBX9390605.1 hypothetical protein [Streptomonospora nanhaiensis]
MVDDPREELRRRLDSGEVSAAHVAFSARARGWPVVTSAPAPLLALDAAIEIERLP